MTPIAPLLMAALIAVESGGNDRAVGKWGELGCLQIGPAALDDVNRIQDQIHFTATDCFDRERSKIICTIYLDHYAAAGRLGREPTDEDRARIWRLGPLGWLKRKSIPYWKRVKTIMEANENQKQ